jgi:glucosamine kinase
MSSSTAAVLGIDVGGTHSRAVVAELDGRVRGRADGPGANRWSSARDGRAAIEATTAGALAAAGGASIRAAVLGIAGWGHQTTLAAQLSAALGPHAPSAGRPLVRVVPDVVANHAAGSGLADGLVLAAGTGAIAARIVEDEVAQRADGCGWLLGDEGSAVWLGLEAVRAALRAVDGRGPGTDLVGPLTEILAPHLADDVTTDDLRAALVDAGHSLPPARFGSLAPSVLAVAEHGDWVADAIVAQAAEHLVRTVRTVGEVPAPERLVLAGSLLLSSQRLRTGVLAALRASWPGLSVSRGRDGAAGAAALALRSLSGRPLAAEVHRRLCGPIELED